MKKKFNQFKKKTLLIWVAILSLLAFGAGLLIVLWIIAPVSSSTDSIEVRIERGSGVNQIGQELESKGLIRTWIALRLYTQFFMPGTTIQAGNFVLSPSMTLFEIAQMLQKGTDDAKVTLLEGWRAEEVAEELERSIEGFDAQVFLDIASSSEGRLFPDTYVVSSSISEQEMFDLMISTFNSKVAEPLAEKQLSSGLTWQEVLTLASLVEREAKTTEARRMVSGILFNRIEQDWPLQVDATLQYIKGYDEKEQTWWAVPLAADKSLDSPYNTYKFAGIPPGPIANPSLSSILSVLDPIPSKFMFYISDRQGMMYYAESYEEHNRNIDRYLR